VTRKQSKENCTKKEKKQEGHMKTALDDLTKLKIVLVANAEVSGKKLTDN